MKPANQTAAGTEQDSGAQLRECETFLAQHPDVRAIDLLIGDLSGVLRGKRVPADQLPAVIVEGLRMAGSLFALDITGENVDETGLTADEGEMDRICRPVPGTLTPVPWAPQPTAQMLIAMHETNSTPFFADPRHVLSRVIERYDEAGLTPVVSVELEFYLLDRVRGADGMPRLPLSIRTGERLTHSTRCYGIEEIYDFEPFFNRMVEVCEIQGIPSGMMLSEYAPAQFEINLRHVPDPLRAAEHALLLKRAVKAVAFDHGLEATFMALPLAGHTTSGMHVHFSLLDRNGKNLFDDGTEQGSDILRCAIGGLAATMAEAFLLFVPNANSFRRFGGIYAPLSTAWGYNNRTAGLRIPASAPESRRVEHRIAGADANPFLVLAAVLAGAWHGIEHEIEPAPPVTGNAFAKCKPTLPVTWDGAIAAFDCGTIVPELLGRDFCRVFSAVRTRERERFNAYVTPLEYEWYLRSL